MLNAPDQFKADCNNYQPYWSVAAVLLKESGSITIDDRIDWYLYPEKYVVRIVNDEHSCTIYSPDGSIV